MIGRLRRDRSMDPPPDCPAPSLLMWRVGVYSPIRPGMIAEC
jgi:hypothetical protein